MHIWKLWCAFSFRRDLRFIEVVENVCQRLLEYNLHKERSGSNRFAKVSPSVGACVCERESESFGPTLCYYYYLLVMFTEGLCFFRNAFLKSLDPAHLSMFDRTHCCHHPSHTVELPLRPFVAYLLFALPSYHCCSLILFCYLGNI